MRVLGPIDFFINSLLCTVFKFSESLEKGSAVDLAAKRQKMHKIRIAVLAILMGYNE
jgi:hypothetical protein